MIHEVVVMPYTLTDSFCFFMVDRGICTRGLFDNILMLIPRREGI